jgi:hypothetical protein
MRKRRMSFGKTINTSEVKHHFLLINLEMKDYFNDEEGSEEYSQEEDVPDEFDEDFQETTSDEEEEDEDEEEDNKKKKKDIFAPKKKPTAIKKFIESEDKKQKKISSYFTKQTKTTPRTPKVKKMDEDFVEEPPEMEVAPEPEQQPLQEDRRATRGSSKPVEPNNKIKILLKPTKGHKKPSAKEKKEQIKPLTPLKKKGKYIHDFFTQAELMKEAAITEIFNKKSLVYIIFIS